MATLSYQQYIFSLRCEEEITFTSMPTFIFRSVLGNQLKVTCSYSLPVYGEVCNAYNEKISNPNNQLLIHELYRGGRKLSPVLPGSSLKGAIRTAVLNFLTINSELNILRNERDSRKVEAEILHCKPKDFRNDPCRTVHISDGTVVGKNNHIM